MSINNIVLVCASILLIIITAVVLIIIKFVKFSATSNNSATRIQQELVPVKNEESPKSRSREQHNKNSKSVSYWWNWPLVVVVDPVTYYSTTRLAAIYYCMIRSLLYSQKDLSLIYNQSDRLSWPHCRRRRSFSRVIPPGEN